MRICALDQASKKTGYAIFEDNKLVDYGLINMGGESDINNRLYKMVDEIHSIIKQSQANQVVFEDVSQRNNVKTLISLSRLQGMIMEICYQDNIDFLIYPPSTWRSIIGITQGASVKRSELKWQAIEYVNKHYNIKVTDDVAESICIGLAYIKEHNFKD